VQVRKSTGLLPLLLCTGANPAQGQCLGNVELINALFSCLLIALTLSRGEDSVCSRIGFLSPEELRLPAVSPNRITELLLKWKCGDQESLNVLLPLVYGELRRLAQHHLRGERSDHTLQSTALVHEAYLRLVKPGSWRFESRSHFFALASQLMREILVDHARIRSAAKRDGGSRLTLDEAAELSGPKGVDLLALDDALNQLSRMSPRQGRIVELRFFGGLSIEETAEFLRISSATVEREWAVARAWLYREMSGAERQ
jgi:RNA polymerase sigma factor (TIGR02999 family)